MNFSPTLPADTKRIGLTFNSSNRIQVVGSGTVADPWRPLLVEDVIFEEGNSWRKAFDLEDEPNLSVFWRRLDDVSSGSGWLPLEKLWHRAEQSPETVAPLWLRLLPKIRSNAIEIPYLNFGPNEFIYRFRTDRQRNRSIYQSDDTSRSIYQSRLCDAIKTARRLKENRSGDPAVLDFGPVVYLLPSHFGFCLGVQNAIERAYEVISGHPGRRVFMLSELIHNPYVNQDLTRRGLLYLQSDKGKAIVDPNSGKPYWESLSGNDVVIIPAFGATNEDKVRLLEKGLPLNEFDATCMLVEKVWKAARRFALEGYTVVIHGKAEHEETKATFSNTARHGPALIIRDGKEAERLGEVVREMDPLRQRALFEQAFSGKHSAGFDPARDLNRIAVVNQTTLLRNETLRIIEFLEGVMKEKYGDSAGEHIHSQSRGDTLCYATQVNQDALQRALEEPLDLALVAGGTNSSNTYQLYRICAERLGAQAAYIQSEQNLIGPGCVRHFHFAQNPDDPLAGQFEERDIRLPEDRPMRVLLTGGASCPDGIIQQIITRLNQFFPSDSLRPIDEIVQRIEGEI